MANEINIWQQDADGTYGTAGNWSLGTAPADTENIIIPAGSPSITTALDDTGGAKNYSSFTVESGYTGTIGTSALNLKITTSAFSYSGTGQAFIDLAASAIAPVVNQCASGTKASPGLQLKGTKLTTLTVYGSGVVGFGVDDAELVGAGNHSDVNILTAGGSATVYVGRFVEDVAESDHPSVNVHGTAVVDLDCETNDIVVYSGTLHQRGGVLTNVNGSLLVYKGTAYLYGSGIYSDVDVESRGSVINADATAKNFALITIENGGKLTDSFKSVTFGAAISFPTGESNCKLDFGVARTYQPSNP